MALQLLGLQPSPHANKPGPWPARAGPSGLSLRPEQQLGGEEGSKEQEQAEQVGVGVVCGRVRTQHIACGCMLVHVTLPAPLLPKLLAVRWG